jgi:5-methylcytosine-specific restriction endonuclease McrA
MPFKDKTEYNNYLNEYMKSRWVLRRASAVEYLGGKCAWCNSTGNLEFDHIDPYSKLMSIARASSRSEKFFWAEVDKCQLLCHDCHLVKTQQDK